MTHDEAEDILRPDEAEMIRHLDHLFGNNLDGCQEGMVELAWTDPETGHLSHGKLFGTDQFYELAEEACQLNVQPNCNVYIGAALRKPDAQNGRCGDNDFYALTAYYADLDDESAAQGVKQRINEYHNQCLPTAAVMTGTQPHPRVQLWWKLETPDRDPDHCRAVTGAVAMALGGDRTVINPSRVMRLAGSIAWPVKQGRIKERTKLKLFQDGRKPVLMEGEMDRAFPYQTYAHIQTPGDVEAGQDVIKDGLDRVTDGRERYMTKVIAGVMANMVREDGNYPTADELFEKAWPVYESNVKPRAGNLEEEGRGPTAFRQKVEYALRRLHAGKIRGLESLEDAAIDSAVEKALSGDETGAPDTRSGPVSAASLGQFPPEREWIIKDWLPKNTVTALYGDGGTGKTLLAQQLATCLVTGRPWLGMEIEKPGKALCIFCEDDYNELWRRQVAVEDSLNIFTKNQVSNLWLWPSVGHDNLLVTFDMAGNPKATAFYDLLLKTVAYHDPDLLVLDTAADLFGGNENNRSQVNFFIKSILGSFCVETNTTILLLAHPSVTGLNTGTGFGGSTAWNNAVRSRWYLSRADEGMDDQRVLTRKKSNYSKAGDDERIDMMWSDGSFKLPSSPDMIDRIQQKNLKNNILDAIEEAWEKGTPITKQQGSRPYKEVLPRLLGESGKLVAKAVKELEYDGYIASSKNSNKRGFHVVERPKW